MTDDTSGSQQQPASDRDRYLACSRSLSNAEWLMAQYDKSADAALALRAFHHLREAEKHLEAALCHHSDAGQRERYQQQYNALRERILSAIETFEEGTKITASRDIDAQLRRATLLNLYRLSRLLGHGINESYRDIAKRTSGRESDAEVINQALRGYAKPYMDRKISREDGLLCAFYGIDVEMLAGLDRFELVERIPELSAERAADLILAARNQETKG